VRVTATRAYSLQAEYLRTRVPPLSQPPDLSRIPMFHRPLREALTAGG